MRKSSAFDRHSQSWAVVSGDFQDRLYPPVPLAVIPAKAGIYFPGGALDSRLRGNDRPGSFLSDNRLKIAAAVSKGHSFQEIASVVSWCLGIL